MLTFKIFLRKLRGPIFASIGVAVLVFLYHGMAYGVRTVGRNSQIEFYQKFLHVDDPLPKDKKESDETKTFRWFVYFMRDIGAAKENHVHRLDSLQNLNKNYRYNFQVFRDKTGNNPALMSTLIFEKEKIPPFVKKEEEKKKNLSAEFHPYPSRRFIFRALQWISVGWFIGAWIYEGRSNIFYFPLRAWWFYVYLVLTFPASLMLATVTLGGEALGFLANMADARHEKFRTAFENLKKRFRSRATYNEFCAKIARDKDKYRKSWVDSFSAQRVNIQVQQETGRLTGLKETLVRKGREVEEMQRGYFEGREHLRQLERIPDMSQRIGEEFDELYKNHSVKALEIKDGKLIVYTEALSGSGGLVGPFRVEIPVTGDRKNVFLATDSAHRHPVGGGGRDGSFCFGTANELISRLLREFRFAEATGLMFQAFESF